MSQPGHLPGEEDTLPFSSISVSISSQCNSEVNSLIRCLSQTELLLENGISKHMDVLEVSDPFISPSDSTRQDETATDNTFSQNLSCSSSQGFIEQKQTVKRVDEDKIPAEERYERLVTLLERATVFTEVVGGQVRKQQEKRRKESEKRIRNLKDLPLTDISPNTDTKPSREPVGEIVQENRSLSRKRPRTTKPEQDCKRFKPVSVRYYKDEIIPTIQPNLLTGGVLRDYQVDGYDWLRLLYENGINGILADEMGLGKTIQTIAFICYLVERGVSGPFLIVSPLSTLYNWKREFARFAPSIYTLLYHGDKKERKYFFNIITEKERNISESKGKNNQLPVVITHYGLVRSDFRRLFGVKWTYLILDEGHQIKNCNTRVNHCLNKFNCEGRLILTGTPIQNKLTELWSLVNFLMPAIFDDRDAFKRWFDVEGNLREEVIDRERERPIIEMIQKIIRPFIMRRMKSDVSLNLPPKKEILVYCPLTRIQKNFYRALLERTIVSMIDKEYGIEEVGKTEEGSENTLKRAARCNIDYSEMTDEEFMDILDGNVKLPSSWTGEVVKIERPDLLPVKINVSALKTSVHLRKVVNHPYLIAHPYDETEDGKALIISEEMVQVSGKMRILDQMLKNLISKGHKMLLYSQWVRVLDLMQDLMELRDIKFVRLHGAHTLKIREAAIEQFQNDKSIKCFLISTRAGGLGINLTAADTVIIFDSDWNPHVDSQAQDRCHRIGQTKPVIVYRLVAARTIDQKLVERAFKKKKLDKILINNKDFCKNSWRQEKITPLKIEELQELLTELEYDQQIGGGEDFTEEQMETLLDRPNLIEGVSNKAFRVVSNQTTDN